MDLGHRFWVFVKISHWNFSFRAEILFLHRDWWRSFLPVSPCRMWSRMLKSLILKNRATCSGPNSRLAAHNNFGIENGGGWASLKRPPCLRMGTNHLGMEDDTGLVAIKTQYCDWMHMRILDGRDEVRCRCVSQAVMQDIGCLSHDTSGWLATKKHSCCRLRISVFSRGMQSMGCLLARMGGWLAGHKKEFLLSGELLCSLW